MMEHTLQQIRGLDVYVLDQLMKGRISKTHKILDAGCGGGRNVQFMMAKGFDVSGFDRDERAMKKMKAVIGRTAPALEPQFHLADAEKIPFENESFDVVMSIAVLHFSENKNHFERQLQELMRVLRPGGMFFARLASKVGIEDQIQDIGNGRYHLPDGSDRYLVSHGELENYTKQYKGKLLDPIKSSVVHGMRSMATICFEKG